MAHTEPAAGCRAAGDFCALLSVPLSLASARTPLAIGDDKMGPPLATPITSPTRTSAVCGDMVDADTSCASAPTTAAAVTVGRLSAPRSFIASRTPSQSVPRSTACAIAAGSSAVLLGSVCVAIVTNPAVAGLGVRETEPAMCAETGKARDSGWNGSAVLLSVSDPAGAPGNGRGDDDDADPIRLRKDPIAVLTIA